MRNFLDKTIEDNVLRSVLKAGRFHMIIIIFLEDNNLIERFFLVDYWLNRENQYR